MSFLTIRNGPLILLSLKIFSRTTLRYLKGEPPPQRINAFNGQCVVFVIFRCSTVKLGFPEQFLCITGDEPMDYWLSDLCSQLSAVVASKPGERMASQIGDYLPTLCVNLVAVVLMSPTSP